MDNRIQWRPIIELRSVVKYYGNVIAVHKVDLDLEQGTFLTLLGPSGCGKTTALRMIAGLTAISDGALYINGQYVNDVPVHRRNLGFVFQHQALFPHRTVFDNIAFGLKYRNLSKYQIRKRVCDILDLIQLSEMASKMPRQLSGGQQQRVALARAIVIQPNALLLDEPFSALDASLRETMRIELKRIQQDLGMSTILVTHDQSEALAMSDRVAVMNAGRIEQVGNPQEIYHDPASEFVATFLGYSNILDAHVLDRVSNRVQLGVHGLGSLVMSTDHQASEIVIGDRVKLSIRAERVMMNPGIPAQENDIELRGHITMVDYRGQNVRYFTVVNDVPLQIISSDNSRLLPVGTAISVRISACDCAILLPKN